MPRSKLAMVAVCGNHEGPWIRVGEIATASFEVRGLGDEAVLRLEFDRPGAYAEKPLRPGCNRAILIGWDRYRVVKFAPARDACKTTVEIFPDERTH